jgi:hypothetical protein
MSRTRVRSRADSNIGTYKRYNASGTLISQSIQTGAGSWYKSTIIDEFGGHDLPFNVDAGTVTGNQFDVHYTDPSGARTVIENWSFDPNPGMYAFGTDPNIPNNSALAVTCLKRTNPSKPHIDLPVALAELRDLPDMVKSGGETAAEKFAHGTLQREFGYAPFLSDLKKLFSFKDKVQKRVELLSKFKDGPMLRKTKLYDSTVQSSIPADRTVISGAFGSLSATVTSYTTVRRYYGYVTYTPNADMSKLIGDSDALRAKARDIIGGLTIDASTIWQAMPWSWLADWFGNLGDYLEAHRNLLPLKAGTPRICKPIETTVTCRLNGNAVTGPLSSQYVHKRTWTSREIVSAAFPSADLPFLTKRQVDILGSLYITRGRGASHH